MLVLVYLLGHLQMRGPSPCIALRITFSREEANVALPAPRQAAGHRTLHGPACIKGRYQHPWRATWRALNTSNRRPLPGLSRERRLLASNGTTVCVWVKTTTRAILNQSIYYVPRCLSRQFLPPSLVILLPSLSHPLMGCCVFLFLYRAAFGGTVCSLATDRLYYGAPH